MGRRGTGLLGCGGGRGPGLGWSIKAQRETQALGLWDTSTQPGRPGRQFTVPTASEGCGDPQEDPHGSQAHPHGSQAHMKPLGCEVGHRDLCSGVLVNLFVGEWSWPVTRQRSSTVGTVTLEAMTRRPGQARGRSAGELMLLAQPSL